MNGLGSSFQVSIRARMSALSALTERWAPRRGSLLVSSANQRSTRVSDDELVGDLAVERGQERLEPDRAGTRLQLADHLAGGEIKRRVEARAAGAPVVVGGTPGRAGQHRQDRRGAIEGLDLGLLIDAQHDRALGRVENRPTTSRTLSMNCGSLESFQVSWRCGWSPNACQIRSTAFWVRPTSRAIERVDQCVASLGVVSSVRTTTSSTCSSVIVRGRPGRGSSVSPSSRRSAKRLRHLVTIGRVTPSRWAISVFLSPSAAASTIRDRCANPWALVRRRAHASNRARSSSVSAIAAATGTGIVPPFPTANELNHQDTRTGLTAGGPAGMHYCDIGGGGNMGRRALVFAALVAVGLVTAAPAGATGPPPGVHDALRLETLSGPARYVSGGAARVRVVVPATVPLSAASVTLNGADVTSWFAPDDRAPHALEGVLTDLPLGSSTVAATVPGPGRSANDRAALELVNHPATGPMFSGPQQPDFFCSTAAHLAGFDLSGPFLDEDCSLPTRVAYYYRTANGTWKPYDAAAPRPADMTQTTTSDGDTVDFVIRWERGTLNRFIYTIAVLDPTASGPRSLPYWNRKLIYYFGGGVAIGHYQGSNNQNESRYPYGLGQGYAIAWSTGTKTNTHYNLVLGGETALMVKSRFVTEYDDPEYTVGLGGSGGAIQQYVYGQNHPGLLDGAIPQYSYPDMVTQTIHVGDCELLERWMDHKVQEQGQASKWRVWTNRSWLEGLSTSNTVVANVTGAIPWTFFTPWLAFPGSSECIKGWRGLSPLALNPNFGTVPGITP